MKTKIRAHLITLPRWFAAPVCICAVVLGGVIGGGDFFPIILAVITALLLMAAAHSSNTWLDFYWTCFDLGTAEERSYPKVYTRGQQPIAAGILSGKEVLGNILFWLGLSAIPAGILSVIVSPWIWLFWVLTVACSPFYSWGKLHYLCEMALGLGFGSIACCLGVSVSPNPDYLKAFLAGIPILILWGFAAETLDQFLDAEPNWPRGLRNLGALVWKSETSITVVIGWLFSVTFISQLFFILVGILSTWTALTLITFIPFTLCLILLQRKTPRLPHMMEPGDNVVEFISRLSQPVEDPKAGILWGLGGIYLYVILLAIGQIIGG